MIERLIQIGGLALSMHALPALASAADLGSEPWTFHGYGSLGAVYHDATGVEYRRDVAQPVNGANAGRLLFDRDSMLGLQADYRGNDVLSASLQAVVRQDADKDFTPRISMGLLKYQDGSYLLRAGRLIIETYMAGDAAEVGYANQMVHQPLLFYPRHMDGLDAEYAAPLGEGLLRVKGMAGKTLGTVVSVGGRQDMKGSTLVGIGSEYARGCWTARLVTARLDIAKEMPEMLPGGTLDTALSSLPNAAALRDVLSMQRRMNVSMLELAYDDAGWQGHAAYAVTRSHAWADQHSMFVNAGYRMGDVMPYASFSFERTGRTLVGTGIPNGTSTQMDSLNLKMSQAEAAHLVNQNTYTLGLRYDFMRNRALKVQWDRIRYQDTHSLIDRSQSGVPVASRGFKSMNLYSVVLDFVF